MKESMLVPQKELKDLASILTVMEYMFNDLVGRPEIHILYDKLAKAIMQDNLTDLRKGDIPSSFIDEHLRTGYLIAGGYTLEDFRAEYKGTASARTQYSYIGSAVITDLLALDYWKNGKKPVEISLKTSVIRQELVKQVKYIKAAISEKSQYITIHEPVRHHVEGILKDKYAKDNQGKASLLESEPNSSNSNVVKLGFKHVPIK